ncbi:MAG: hypothetical protein P8X74_17780 [Reinekea sp.]
MQYLIEYFQFLGSKEESMACALHPLWNHGFRSYCINFSMKSIPA